MRIVKFGDGEKTEAELLAYRYPLPGVYPLTPENNNWELHSQAYQDKRTNERSTAKEIVNDEDALTQFLRSTIGEPHETQ